MKYINLPIGEIITGDYGIKWKRTNIRDEDSGYEDNYYYMPIKCHCNVDCTGCGYTVSDEYGECDHCLSVIRQIHGHNDDIEADFSDTGLFSDMGKKKIGMAEGGINGN